MKCKNKIIRLLFLFLLSSTVFFGLPSGSISQSHLIINEVLPTAGTGKSAEEFIELYNPTDSAIDAEALPLKLHIVNSKGSDSGKILTFINKIIPAKGYFLIASKDYADDSANSAAADATYSTSGNSLVADGAVYISSSTKSSENIIDSLGFGTNTFFSLTVPNPASGKSAERIAFDKDDWQDSYVLGGTPGEKNSEAPEPLPSPTAPVIPSPTAPIPSPTAPGTYGAKIIINELLPHPADGDTEYIELYNTEKDDIDLSGYVLHDASKTGKFVIPDKTKIKSHGYLVFYKTTDFKFALNDSGDETVTLYDPNENIVDQVAYHDSQENYSLSFDGKIWHWTKYQTPGDDNKFEKKLSGDIEMDKDIYADIYANFDIKCDDAVNKFTWDFGDGHKSYLKSTRHKYKDEGIYLASLKISGDGEDNDYNFTVNVQKYKAADVSIVEFSPNPKGNDAKNEWILIENSSHHSVSLKGWSIATGNKKLINHPIRKTFRIGPGKTKELTRKFSAFTLGNKKSKVELRDPTGDRVQLIKYDFGKEIAEDQTCEVSGKKCHWNIPVVIKKISDRGQKILPPPVTPKTESDIIASPEEILSGAGKFSQNPAWQNKRQLQIKLLSYKTNIETPSVFLESHGRVLGLATEISLPPEKHWSVVLLNNIWLKINSGLNWILNKF